MLGAYWAVDGVRRLEGASAMIGAFPGDSAGSRDVPARERRAHAGAPRLRATAAALLLTTGVALTSGCTGGVADDGPRSGSGSPTPTESPSAPGPSPRATETPAPAPSASGTVVPLPIYPSESGSLTTADPNAPDVTPPAPTARITPVDPSPTR